MESSSPDFPSLLVLCIYTAHESGNLSPAQIFSRTWMAAISPDSMVYSGHLKTDRKEKKNGADWQRRLVLLSSENDGSPSPPDWILQSRLSIAGRFFLLPREKPGRIIINVHLEMRWTDGSRLTPSIAHARSRRVDIDRRYLFLFLLFLRTVEYLHPDFCLGDCRPI